MSRDGIEEVEAFLQVYKDLTPRQRKMLHEITLLQSTAFTAPRHWDHEPSAKELAEEDRLCKQSQRDFAALEQLVDHFAASLKSPFA